MSKDFAWQLFKNTGNIDAFMIWHEIESAEEIVPHWNAAGEKINGNNQNKGNRDESRKFFGDR